MQDIGGNDIQKQEMREAVELPLTHFELYRQIGIDPPRGVLLWGPPGTGKTMLAKAVAHHTTAAFIRVVGSEFVQKYLGEVRTTRAYDCLLSGIDKRLHGRHNMHVLALMTDVFGECRTSPLVCFVSRLRKCCVMLRLGVPALATFKSAPCQRVCLLNALGMRAGAAHGARRVSAGKGERAGYNFHRRGGRHCHSAL